MAESKSAATPGETVGASRVPHVRLGLRLAHPIEFTSGDWFRVAANLSPEAEGEAHNPELFLSKQLGKFLANNTIKDGRVMPRLFALSFSMRIALRARSLPPPRPPIF
jgi:hypothetical protein